MNQDTTIKVKTLDIKILTLTCRESKSFPLWHKFTQAVESSNYRVSSVFYFLGDNVCPFVKWVWDSVLPNLWLLHDILGTRTIYKTRKNQGLTSSLVDGSIYSLQNDIFTMMKQWQDLSWAVVWLWTRPQVCNRPGKCPDHKVVELRHNHVFFSLHWFWWFTSDTAGEGAAWRCPLPGEHPSPRTAT